MNEQPEKVTPDNYSAETKNKSGRTGLVVGLLALAAILVVSFWIFLSHNNSQEQLGDSTAQFNDLSEAELAEPVAYVNGMAITRAELEEGISQMMQWVLQSGLDPNDPAVRSELETEALESVISNELLKQASASVDAPSAERVENELAILVEESGGQAEFERLLVEYGFTVEELRASLAERLRIEDYLDETLEAVAVDEAEIITFYDSLGGEEAGYPPLDNLREQIEGELVAKKQQSQISELLAQLRAEAEVEII